MTTSLILKINKLKMKKPKRMLQRSRPNYKWSKGKHQSKILIKSLRIMVVIKAMALMLKTATRAEEAIPMSKLNSKMREEKL